jgi:hypothetical protein
VSSRSHAGEHQHGILPATMVCATAIPHMDKDTVQECRSRSTRHSPPSAVELGLSVWCIICTNACGWMVQATRQRFRHGRSHWEMGGIWKWVRILRRRLGGALSHPGHTSHKVYLWKFLPARAFPPANRSPLHQLFWGLKDLQGMLWTCLQNLDIQVL